jgi:hypothetical protein
LLGLSGDVMGALLDGIGVGVWAALWWQFASTGKAGWRSGSLAPCRV